MNRAAIHGRPTPPMPRNEELALWRSKQFWKHCSVILASALALLIIGVIAVIDAALSQPSPTDFGGGVPAIEWHIQVDPLTGTSESEFNIGGEVGITTNL